MNQEKRVEWPQRLLLGWAQFDISHVPLWMYQVNLWVPRVSWVGDAISVQDVLPSGSSVCLINPRVGQGVGGGSHCSCVGNKALSCIMHVHLRSCYEKFYHHMSWTGIRSNHSVNSNALVSEKTCNLTCNNVMITFCDAVTKIVLPLRRTRRVL